MHFEPRHIPVKVLATITGRPPEHVRAKTQAAENVIPVVSAVNYVMRLIPTSQIHGKRRVTRFRIPLATTLAFKLHCSETRQKHEKFLNKVAQFAVDEARGTDILRIYPPAPPHRGVPKKLLSFSPYLWMALQVVAYSCRTTPSMVLTWGIDLYLLNQDKLKRR